MDRKYPNIRGKVGADIENEIMTFADHLYDIIEGIAVSANVSTDISRETKPSATSAAEIRRNNQSPATELDKGIFAQPFIGGPSDPNLKGAIPDDVIRSNMTVTPGAVPVGGFITIIDGFGHSVDILTK